MAKYMASPWGRVRGKLGDVVGGRSKGGIDTIRMNTVGKHRGTEQAVLEADKDESKRKDINIKQFNQTHIAMAPLTTIAYQFSKRLMFEVWEPLVGNRPITGANLFTKINVARLCSSIPDRTKFYSPANAPDISSILLTDGRLEPAEIFSAKLSIENSEITVNWKPGNFSNGEPDDNVSLSAVYWKIPESKKWYPDFKPCRTMMVWNPEFKKGIFDSLAKRQDGTAKLKLANPDIKLLDMQDAQLVVFLFLYNDKDAYSRSSSYKLFPPRTP